MIIELKKADVRLLIAALESEHHATEHLGRDDNGRYLDAETKARVEHIYSVGQKLRRALKTAA